MTVTAKISVNDIMNRVAVECGLEAVTDPYGSPAQHFVQMKYLLQTAGDELCLAFPWEFLVRKFDITVLAGDDNQYDLPTDFVALTDQTGWNNSTDEPLIGPLSAQEWEAIVSVTTPVTSYCYRIFDGVLNVLPDPPTEGINLTFEYQSRNWVEDGDTPGTYKDIFTAGADIVLYDRTLITRLLKVMWLEAKGFDTTAAQNSLNQVYNNIIGKDKGGKVLDAGRPFAVFRYLDVHNVPLTGFGL